MYYTFFRQSELNNRQAHHLRIDDSPMALCGFELETGRRYYFLENKQLMQANVYLRKGLHCERCRQVYNQLSGTSHLDRYSQPVELVGLTQAEFDAL